MMITSISKSDILSSEEINKLISLLHPAYQELDFSIEIYNNIEECVEHKWEWLGNLPIEERLDFIHYVNEFVAFADLDKKLIILVQSEILNDETIEISISTKKLHIIYTLLHEIRHAWQSRYKPQYFKGEEYYYVKMDEYAGLPQERDADRFASRMMNNFRKEINEMCNIDLNWIWVHGWYAYILHESTSKNILNIPFNISEIYN